MRSDVNTFIFRAPKILARREARVAPEVVASCE
jgi:hypothetical protein